MAGLRILLLVSPFASLALAHETDQHTMPLGRKFADLGPYFTRDFFERIDRAVRKTNARIQRARQRGNEAEAQRLRGTHIVIEAVHAEFPSFVTYIDNLDRRLHSKQMKRRYPGLVVAWKPRDWVYSSCFPLDVRQIYRLWDASTIMIDGTYFGTDKLGHFVHNGWFYYLAYRRALERGETEEQALRQAIELGAGGDFFHSERRLLGYLTSGIFSNADLAANYVGFKFYRNLVEDQQVCGRMRKALLQQRNGYWATREGVTPRSGFLIEMISDHFNEVFNPNLYALGVEEPARKGIAARCELVCAWYVDINGRQLSRGDFDAVFEYVRTYFGEAYGHDGMPDEMVSVANVCFAPEKPADDTVGERYVSGRSGAVLLPRGARRLSRTADGLAELERVAQAGSDVDAPDTLGRTPLRQAVRYGEEALVAALIGAGAEVSAVDVDGETPLHDAVRFCQHEIVDLLLERGADVRAVNCYAATALHLAVRHADARMVRALLNHGAEVDARDAFGCTALHDAAALGGIEVTEVLLAGGADLNAVDFYNSTALHLAARYGWVELAAILLGRGAHPTTANKFGRRPFDEALRSGSDRIVSLLKTAVESPGTPFNRSNEGSRSLGSVEWIPELPWEVPP